MILTFFTAIVWNSCFEYKCLLFIKKNKKTTYNFVQWQKLYNKDSWSVISDQLIKGEDIKCIMQGHDKLFKTLLADNNTEPSETEKPSMLINLLI